MSESERMNCADKKDGFEGRCKFCFWNRNLPRCKPEKMINLSGNCKEWRRYKMSDNEKKAEKAKKADAHTRDKERRKEQRKSRKKGPRGGS